MSKKMIKATLTRKWLSEKQTLGVFELFEPVLDDDGIALWDCYTCEDPVGDTAIPYGTYKVRKTYSNRFKRDMWELQNVARFSGIRIHAGNTAKDTEGCILLGQHINGDYTGVSQSRAAVAEFEAVMDKLGNPEFELEVV